MKILYGGLTYAHDFLIKGAMESLGYDVEPLPTPDNEALKVGKEYCNKGQCNPTYYTVGNLVKYLLEKKEKGEWDIENKYVFVTAGACGPCRFGMYEMEYRKAVRDAGFPNFKILTFEQSSAVLNEAEASGIKFNKEFFISLMKAIILGDLINDIYYKVKPYEVIPNSADEWKEEALNILYETLKEGNSIFKSLREIKRKLDKVEVNYFHPKPRVKITGEFFAQTTEGDGNYKMAKWLIEEGAEPIVEPVSTWIEYLIFEKINDTKEKAFKNRKEAYKMILALKVLNAYFRGMYNLYRFALGNKPDPLKSQKKLAEYAKNYYNIRLSGGEGHMEVGKHIYMIKHKKAHMVISVKPFGCMPSTQSDGVQSKVVEDLGGSLFVSVETSGDAEANVKSRVLMKLYEAKMKAIEEYEELKRKFKLSDEEIDRRRQKVKSAGIKLPSKYATTACNALLLIK